MRSQRRPPVTVTVVQLTTTVDKYGDGTSPDPVRTVVDGAIFEPEQMVERVGDDQAPVLRPAHWNLPGVFELDSDDRIEIGPEEAPTDVWLVDGGSAVWLDRTKVPVKQAKGS